VFGLGSGSDRISETEPTGGGQDLLAIGPGPAADQIWLCRSGNDLEVSVIGTPDKATITNWYAGASFQVEQFRTADGKTLLSSRVEALVSAMAAFAPPAPGQITLPQDYRNALNPVIAANWR
jgi:hypothetical protein